MAVKRAEPTLIFVYNADSGVFNLAADIAHKIFSPQTYSCNLCAITHSTFGMKNEWRDYLATLKVPFEFLHANELKAESAVNSADLPAVFLWENGELKIIIDSAAINACRTIDDLKRIINEKLAEAG
jgi:hypothetical protein